MFYWFQASHPEIGVLKGLLPKSVVHPPRHSLTLPFPTSGLRVYDGQPDIAKIASSGHPGAKAKASEPSVSKRKAHTTSASTALPIPHVHYAPLHIKGITTSAPVDGTARKQKRLEEVRKRRVEVKEKKKKEREDGIRRWEKSLGKGKKKGYTVRIGEEVKKKAIGGKKKTTEEAVHNLQ